MLKVMSSAFLLSLFAAFSYAQTLSDEQFESSDIQDDLNPSFNSASPGVFISERENSRVVHAFGVEGMQFMRDYLDEIVSNQDSLVDHSFEVLRDERDRLDRELSNLESDRALDQSTQAESSGVVCSFPYDLSAIAQRVRFWGIEAIAESRFRQHNPLLGPRPEGTATLSTFAKVEFHNSTLPNDIFIESDQKTYDVVGDYGPPSFVGADPAHVHFSFAAGGRCVTAEAISTISFSNCIGGFQGVSEKFYYMCD